MKIKKGSFFGLIIMCLMVTGFSGIYIQEAIAPTYYYSYMRFHQVTIDRIEITDEFGTGSYNIYYGLKYQRHGSYFGSAFTTDNTYEDCLSLESSSVVWPSLELYGSFYGEEGLKTIINKQYKYSYSKHFGNDDPGNELQIFISVARVSSPMGLQNLFLSFGDVEQAGSYLWTPEYDFGAFAGKLRVRYMVKVYTELNPHPYFPGMEVPLELHKMEVYIQKIEVTDAFTGYSAYDVYFGFKWKRHWDSYGIEFTADTLYEDLGGPNYNKAQYVLYPIVGTYNMYFTSPWSYTEPLGLEVTGCFYLYVKLVRKTDSATETINKQLGISGSYGTQYSHIFKFLDFGGTIKVFYTINRL